MSLEETLAGWTSPSSDTEKDKQDRTERMVREAINDHEDFEDCNLTIFAKGSYANNTNVRADSDVDIAVMCHNLAYWEEESEGAHPSSSPYSGRWTPSELRSVLVTALSEKFTGQIDTSGSTAIQVNSSSARVDADVVPCFEYEYHFSSGNVLKGTRIYKKTGSEFENYPDQHLANGKSKNSNTKNFFKKTVRIMKRVENLMVDAGKHREVPSYFIECLVYNCPNDIFMRSTWVSTVEGVLSHIWAELDGIEPTNDDERWLEVNNVKWLFHSSQDWSRQDGRDFVHAAWNYLELGS